MPTRITFLGTAGEHAVFYKYNRCAGGIVLEVQGQFFLLDAGPGTLMQAGSCRFNFRENNAIFLSSARIEQTSDVNGVIDAMTAKGLDKRGVLVAPQKAFTDSSLLKSYQEWMEKVIAAEAGKKIGIEDVTITINHVEDNEGAGFSFATENGVIAYTGNTSYSDELAKRYEGTGILIANVFNPKGVTTPGFLNTQDAIRLVQAARPKLVLITHFGTKMMAAEPLYEAREIQRITGVQTIAAKEGMTLTMTPYASSVIVK